MGQSLPQQQSLQSLPQHIMPFELDTARAGEEFFVVP
jgi:hypothetical protein